MLFLVYLLFFEIGSYSASITGSKELKLLDEYNLIDQWYEDDSNREYFTFLSKRSSQSSANRTINELYRDSYMEIYKVQEDQKCIPESFGYTDEDSLLNFPRMNFPKCADKLNAHKTVIEIDVEKDQLIMNCPDGDGWYYLGCNQDDELIGEDNYHGKKQKYPGHPVKLKNNEEWAYGTCGENFPLQGATYINRPKESSKERAKNIMKTIQAQMLNTKSESQTRPLTVLILTFDSISRMSFYRNLPKTQKFLSSLSPEKFRVFDFKIHNVMGDGSIPNVFPLISGRALESVSKFDAEKNKKNKTDLLGSASIWNYLKSKGWVTLFGTEFCKDYFAKKLGRKPDVDHLMTGFWCAATDLLNYDDSDTDQRCIGNQNSHVYSLNYTYQFIQNYQGINKWAHIMSVPAHEKSGTVVQTLDDDLLVFMKKFLETKDELLIFLMADHGMRYGSWYKIIDGYLEHKLPMLFLIGSTSILQDIPDAIENLSHNADRLVTKTDLHRTLKHLANIPYFRSFNRFSRYEYKSWTAEGDAISLLIDKVQLSRECSKAAIPKIWCSCPKLQALERKVFDGRQTDDKFILEIRKIIENIAEMMIYEINQETYGSFYSEGWRICQKITMKKIDYAEWSRYDYGIHLYKVRVSINEDEKVKYEGLAMVSERDIIERSRKTVFPLSSVINDGKKNLKILYLNRKGPQSDWCKKLSFGKKMFGSLCLCNEYQEIEKYNPIAIEKILNES
ncbi:unnamed protein product [Blepharisma stoltei]|uniref:Uncharacterized protein n=1 Tax=Blepharisma stoltei TaxID=1481888 RepID=A0AAU9K9R9_9CILI|nr:unnamed protein product [Blepharisma stoltei]